MHSTKKETLTSQNSPGALEKWFLAARPKTWIAAVSPVCIGASFAFNSLPLFLATLSFALWIQIGTNFANDYFDFIKGADTEERIGPKRGVQQGWMTPLAMKQAMKIAFAVAFLSSLPLLYTAGFLSLFIIVLSIAFGILYTGGSKPLGYLGFGDLLVFIFFGPIATMGAYYIQTEMFSLPVLIASVAPGLFSTALLTINNLRDAPTDKKAHKKTLVVRFGLIFGKMEYTMAIGIALCIPAILILKYGASMNLWSAVCLFPIGAKLMQKTWQARGALEFAPILAGTSFLFFSYTALLSLGLRLG